MADVAYYSDDANRDGALCFGPTVGAHRRDIERFADRLLSGECLLCQDVIDYDDRFVAQAIVFIEETTLE